MSESGEDYEYYAYSSDEDGGYPIDDDDQQPSGGAARASSSAGNMDWEASPDNPNAAPINFHHHHKPPIGFAASAAGQPKSGIRMMDSEDVRPEMTRKLQDVSDVLGVCMSAAAVLLREHNWSKEELLEDYMNDSDKVLQKSGVYHRCGHVIPPPNPKDLKTCPICYDDVSSTTTTSANTNTNTNTMLAMPCGHSFCYDCWNDFCTHAIEEEGPSCVKTTCPDASCTEVVTEEEISKSLLHGNNNASGSNSSGGSAAAQKQGGDDDDDEADDGSNNQKSQQQPPPTLAKYYTFQLRSYVESNPLTRWCPGAGCERVACAVSPAVLETEGKVAACDKCPTKFCLPCGEEPHAPSSCKDLVLWNEKCRNESETANWILANTKSCPKCISRIEKNQGCNHMTCQKCKFEFCWICMGDWKEHGANTGGYYKCSRYGGNGGDGSGSSDQSDSAKAKRDLDRYLHYYRRFHAHQEAEKFANKQLKETETRMVQLQESSGDDTKWSDVEFLKTANEQLVECRRVLKYTYVYGYYLDPRQTMQRERFEHHQEMLERFTENLSELSEKNPAEMDRTDVVNQTRVVDRFMKNILKYVEDGMDE